MSTFTKTHQTYEKMKNSKYLIKYEHNSNPSESSFSANEFDDIEDIPDNKCSPRQSRKIKLDRSEENKLAKPKCILRESGTTKLNWDISIIVFAIYNSIMTPFNIAFDNEFAGSILSLIIESIINVFFIVDIIINFRTSYMNTKKGEEIFDSKKIAKNYVYRMRFWIDLVSSIPFDMLMIDSLNFLNIIGMLKIVRVTKTSKIIQHLDVRKHIKTNLKILQLLFYILLYIHLQA